MGLKNNQFWKARTKHGRNRIFATPEDLYEAASQYFTWCDRHPIYLNEAIKSGDNAGKIIQVPTAIPYTMTGLCLFLHVSPKFFPHFKKTCSEDFSEVILRIEGIIYTQKFNGAVVGIFNANIISRDLGLVDKQEITGKDGRDLIPFTKEDLDAKFDKIAELFNGISK